MISILFLAAESAEAGEGQQGREAQEIEGTLRLSQFREQFEFFQRLSVRPEDLSQLLLDVKPTVVHFSASSTASGEICVRDGRGAVVPIPSEALADLFSQFSDRLGCVVLSRCFSEKQAEAIVTHVPYVVGLEQTTSSRAVIAFSKGFYQAIAAQKPVEQAFTLGGIQIRLNGIRDCPNPILARKPLPQEDYGPGDSGHFEVLARELDLNEWVYTGYSTEFIRALAIDPRNPEVMYAGTTRGTEEGGRPIYLSEDRGVTWRPIDTELLKRAEVKNLQISPLSGRVYAATDRGLFFSDDRGASWTADNYYADKEIRAVALSPVSGKPFICGTGKYWSGMTMSAATVIVDGNQPEDVHFLADADDVSAGDLHVSLDGGQAYRTARDVKNVNDISVALQDTFFVCMATSDMGVLRSTNGGLDSERAGRLDARNVFCVTISPQNLYDVYAGTESGLFVSHDAGDSWGRVEQIPRTQVTTIVFSRTDSRRIFVSTDIGIFESLDGGSSWNAINRGLDYLWTMSLAVTDQGDIYAGTSGGGVYKKSENRLNWEAVGMGFRARWPFFAVAACNDDLLYGAHANGVCRSLNGGLTWRQVGYFQTKRGRIDSVLALAVLSEASPVDATDGGDLFLSGDGSTTWQSPDNLRVKTICAGTIEGCIYTSPDNARTWQLAVDLGNRIMALVAHPQREGMLFAATLGASIYRSTNFGGSWQSCGQGIDDLDITEIAALPGRSLRLYTGSAHGRLYRSDDLGRSWQVIPADFGDHPIFGIASDETGEVLYIATEGSGVFKTADGGKSWQPANAGLGTRNAYAVVMGPKDRDPVYVGTSQGVYTSKGGADLWARLGDEGYGPTVVKSLSFSRSRPELLFAAASNGLFMILVE